MAHARLKREKRDARPEQLCRNLPSEFEAFLLYCRSLPFTAKPDYQYWVYQFRELAKDNGFTDVDDFVWPPPITVAKVSNLAGMT